MLCFNAETLVICFTTLISNGPGLWLEVSCKGPPLKGANTDRGRSLTQDLFAYTLGLLLLIHLGSVLI